MIIEVREVGLDNCLLIGVRECFLMDNFWLFYEGLVVFEILVIKFGVVLVKVCFVVYVVVNKLVVIVYVFGLIIYCYWLCWIFLFCFDKICYVD